MFYICVGMVAAAALAAAAAAAALLLQCIASFVAVFWVGSHCLFVSSISRCGPSRRPAREEVAAMMTDDDD